jgi:hypothetical protein
LYLTPQCPGFRRSDLRLPLDAGATVMHGGRTVTARLLDLSRSGAALSASGPPPRNAAVILRLDNLVVAARVAWTAGPRFGLCFEARIRATEVFLVMHERRPRGPEKAAPVSG